MVARAYILIETQVGKSRDVIAALQALSNVSSVDIITGEFDMIALVEASDMVATVSYTHLTLPTILLV